MSRKKDYQKIRIPLRFTLMFIAVLGNVFYLIHRNDMHVRVCVFTTRKIMAKRRRLKVLNFKINGTGLRDSLSIVSPAK